MNQSPTSLNKKSVSFKNLLIGAFIQVIEVSTLGQPFEVLKTYMAANREANLRSAIVNTYKRGGLQGYYQGLIPWAWIEAASKGGILLFTSSEIEYIAKALGASSALAGVLGGAGGGICQAYTTMGFCTFMKTVEVTRTWSVDSRQSTMKIALDILKREGIAGLNKGVSAVAVRQMTNWASRFGISRFTQKLMRGDNVNRKLTPVEEIAASAIGGTLSCWNQPIEVIRVEMQSQIKSPNRPPNLNIWSCAKYIYEHHGVRGFFRGVTPRIGLSVYLTICMVCGGDYLKSIFAGE